MISVIIPVYNREKYVEECIRSLQNQSYKNYEIILIDDGSTDDTLAICRRLAAEIPAIRILEGTHAGVSKARNIGLEAARGDFVFFIDSDDIIHPGLLEILVKSLKETDATIAATKCFSIWEQDWGNVYPYIERNPGPGETTYQTFEQTLEAVFCGGKNPLNMIGGVMMRRDLIGDTRFRDDLYIGEDFFFVYENMIKGGSTIFLKEIWYYARNHKDNTSWDFGYTGFMNRLLRRELVWKSEESLGRKKYAAAQKNAAFELSSFAFRKDLPRSEKQKIKKVMRSYRKVLFGDLCFKNKLKYLLYFWIPGGGIFAK